MHMHKPQRDPTIKTSLLPDGHVVLVSSQTDWAHTLSPMGAVIWEFCDGTNSVEDIVSIMQSMPELGYSSQSLQQEVSELLENLEQAGVLQEE